jgi:hypothetical protein
MKLLLSPSLILALLCFSSLYSMEEETALSQASTTYLIRWACPFHLEQQCQKIVRTIVTTDAQEGEKIAKKRFQNHLKIHHNFAISDEQQKACITKIVYTFSSTPSKKRKNRDNEQWEQPLPFSENKKLPPAEVNAILKQLLHISPEHPTAGNQF